MGRRQVRARRLPGVLALALVSLTGSAFGQVQTEWGLVEGVAGTESGVRAYKGLPFAAPPVGDLRWSSPRPVAPREGARKATAFGPRCMQGRIFDDMVFRDEMSEDCLYLNIWTPAKSPGDRLPVMVWIHGGGFQAGSGSEPRQDGERLASRGVVLVNFNYRLGVFGFFAHPELTKESGRGASGNHGLLDQVAALQWVQKNIAAFGGDAGNVTIFGESAGSFAVSALMASPLARGLFQRAIGESGAFFNVGDQALAPPTLTESERRGVEFTTSLGATSLAGLRAKPADDVLRGALELTKRWFAPSVDGFVIPRDVHDIYAEGAQSRVPLLAGWNADEVRAGVVLAKEKPTAASFPAQTKARFGDGADALLKVYPATSDEEALESAAALASDLFLGYATWKWIDMHAATGHSPVYRYSFDHAPPVPAGTKVNGVPATSKDIGARHAGEIEYVFGTLDWSPNVPWQPEDRKLSDLMMAYWTNFARTGDPNGPGLPRWRGYRSEDGYQVMHLAAESKAAPDAHRARYELLDAHAATLRSTEASKESTPRQ